MSRIGNAPISVPGGVDVTIDGSEVTVKGPKGTLTRTFSDRIGFSLEDGVLTVSRSDEERESKALHGLSRALLANMVEGVSAGFTRELHTVGVGYRANLQGKTLELQVGYSHPVRMDAPDGIDFEVPDPTRIIVSGIGASTVDRATLRLTAGSSSRHASIAGGTVYTLTDTAWDESTTSFSSRPQVDGAQLASRGAVATNDVVEFDVTDAVDTDGTYGFAILTESGDAVGYRSREAPSGRPELIISLEAPTTMGPASPAITIRYAENEELSSGFQFAEILEFTREHIGDIIIAVIVLWLVQLVAGLLGTLLCFIGLFFTGIWATMVQGHLYGQIGLDSAGVDSGDSPELSPGDVMPGVGELEEGVEVQDGNVRTGSDEVSGAAADVVDDAVDSAADAVDEAADSEK